MSESLGLPNEFFIYVTTGLAPTTDRHDFDPETQVKLNDRMDALEKTRRCYTEDIALPPGRSEVNRYLATVAKQLEDFEKTDPRIRFENY